MKRIVALLLLPLLAFTFITCKKNNEGEQGKKGKLVKTVQDYAKNENGEWEANVLQTFYYDTQNRLIKIDINNGFSCVYYSYETNYIIITYTPDIYHADTLKFDNNGYLISMGNTTFIYENGYLKEKRVGNNVDNFYTWMNGNLVSVLYHDRNFEYSNREDLLNINIFDDIFDIYCGTLKLKGLSSKNYRIKSFSTKGDDIFATYKYTFGKDGYPTEIIFDVSDGNANDMKWIITYY